MLKSAQQPYKPKDLLMPEFEQLGYAYVIAQWLQSAGDFQTFTDGISQILERLGYSGWAYCRLDVPLSFSQAFGTFTEPYREYDLMYQHLLTSSSCVYRSDVAKAARTSPTATTMLRQNQNIIAQLEQQAFYDAVGIPIGAEGGSNHAAFTLVARGIRSDDLKRLFLAHRDKLNSTIHAIEAIGNKRYPEQFSGQKKRFDKIKYGRPLRLLEAMVKHDCGIEQASASLQMSRTAGDKQLAKIRDYLGTRTNIGAISKAVKLGLIDCNNFSD